MSQSCSFQVPTYTFQPQPQDILIDSDLLELFRVVKQIIRQDPNTERIAKLYFCIVYALGDLYPFYRPINSDQIVFMNKDSTACVQLPSLDSHPVQSPPAIDRSAVRPYTHIQLPESPDDTMEPKQRGFYYQDGRLLQEPVSLQRYAEQGVLTQASLLKKRKKPVPVFVSKKQKIPHRNGEFNTRRDDIIGRMRGVMLADLEQKSRRFPPNYSLAIEKVSLPPGPIDTEEAGDYLEPALAILTEHSNMKPHQDNGMNQNGITITMTTSDFTWPLFNSKRCLVDFFHMRLMNWEIGMQT
ncbi:unnamed protein product [Rhizopus stolonifer]